MVRRALLRLRGGRIRRFRSCFGGGGGRLWWVLLVYGIFSWRCGWTGYHGVCVCVCVCVCFNVCWWVWGGLRAYINRLASSLSVRTYIAWDLDVVCVVFCFFWACGLMNNTPSWFLYSCDVDANVDVAASCMGVSSCCLALTTSSYCTCTK